VPNAAIKDFRKTLSKRKEIRNNPHLMRRMKNSFKEEIKELQRPIGPLPPTDHQEWWDSEFIKPAKAGNIDLLDNIKDIVTVDARNKFTCHRRLGKHKDDVFSANYKWLQKNPPMANPEKFPRGTHPFKGRGYHNQRDGCYQIGNTKASIEFLRRAYDLSDFILSSAYSTQKGTTLSPKEISLIKVSLKLLKPEKNSSWFSQIAFAGRYIITSQTNSQREQGSVDLRSRHSENRNPRVRSSSSDGELALAGNPEGCTRLDRRPVS